MKVKILKEAGYDEAKYGFSLSFKDRAIKPEDWMTPERSRHYDNVLTKNAERDGGHNKFLEHIMVWLDVEASLEWWKQFDTYRVGVSKQSESTMHTLDKRNIVIEDFDLSEEEKDHSVYNNGIYSVKTMLKNYLGDLNNLPPRLKSKLLPQCYLQRREVVLSYKVLRHIIKQREGHKLPEWTFFIDSIYEQARYKHLLPTRTKNV